MSISCQFSLSRLWVRSWVTMDKIRSIIPQRKFSGFQIELKNDETQLYYHRINMNSNITFSSDLMYKFLLEFIFIFAQTMQIQKNYQTSTLSKTPDYKLYDIALKFVRFFCTRLSQITQQIAKRFISILQWGYWKAIFR